MDHQDNSKGQSYFPPLSLWQAPSWDKGGFLIPQLVHSPGLKQKFSGCRCKVGMDFQTDLME